MLLVCGDYLTSTTFDQSTPPCKSSDVLTMNDLHHLWSALINIHWTHLLKAHVKLLCCDVKTDIHTHINYLSFLLFVICISKYSFNEPSYELLNLWL